MKTFLTLLLLISICASATGRATLACGGADAPTNMQWQTREDPKTRDKIERRCGHALEGGDWAPSLR